MTPLLTFILYSSRENSWILAFLGVCAGLYLFYRGFCILQRKRLILNTPASKVRSASMGLVEVSGLAVGPYTMVAPITAMPCYYYRTLAWEYRQSGKSKEWVKAAEESMHLPFFLDDNTGRVLVDPQGAEMDLHRDFHEEYSNSLFSSEEMPANVRSFLTRHAVSTDNKVKIEEYCIQPKNWLFVLGTLAENPGLEVSAQPARTSPADQLSFTVKLPGMAAEKTPSAFESATSVTTTRTVVRFGNAAPPPVEVIQLSSTSRPASSADMTQQGKIAAALLKAGISSPAAWAAAGISGPAATVATATVSAAGASNGNSATDTPAQFDLHPATVLMKGAHNPAFLISWRSQRAIVQSLGWKSALMIWGGPALTLACVYALLAHLGWL